MLNEGSGLFAFFTLLPVFLFLAIIIFAVYFVIKVIKFMNAKTKLDQVRNEKLDEIIKSVNQRNKIE